MKIAHISDRHFDSRRRLGDTIELCAKFAEQCRMMSVDLILDSGDFFERKSEPAERNALADHLRELADSARVVGVRGNHDAAGDLDVFSLLDSEHEIEIHDRPGLVALDFEGMIEPAVAILTLPWADRSHLAASLPPDASIGEDETRALATWRLLLQVLTSHAAAARRDGYVPILLAHCMVAGSETSTGQTLIGQGVELSPSEILDVGCEYAALGHIHKRQEWADGRVSYAGSPERMNFGEPEAKGWNLIELSDSGDFVSNTFVELPARRIVLATPDRLPDDVRGALVRLRYTVRPEDLEAETGRAESLRDRMLDAGACDVKLEAIVEHETRVRSAEIVDARSTWAKVEAYLRAKAIILGDEQLGRMKEKLDAIELRPESCDHGNDPIACDACDRISDHAYDAAREDGRI